MPSRTDTYASFQTASEGQSGKVDWTGEMLLPAAAPSLWPGYSQGPCLAQDLAYRALGIMRGTGGWGQQFSEGAHCWDWSGTTKAQASGQGPA